MTVKRIVGAAVAGVLFKLPHLHGNCRWRDVQRFCRSRIGSRTQGGRKGAQLAQGNVAHGLIKY